jgi:hypothetical protein
MTTSDTRTAPPALGVRAGVEIASGTTGQAITSALRHALRALLAALPPGPVNPTSTDNTDLGLSPRELIA